MPNLFDFIKNSNHSPLARLIVFTLLTVLAVMPAFAIQIGGVVIENLGDVPFDEDSVRITLEAHPGMEFNRNIVTRDIRSLQKTGMFSMVKVDVDSSGQDVVLTYSVVKRPVLERLIVTGADHMGNDKVRKLLDIDLGDPVDANVIGAKTCAVRAAYRKDYYIDPDISWKIDASSDPARATVSVVVKEGSRIKIGKIVFDGNKFFSDKELRSEMSVKAYRFYNPWHWVSGAGRLETGKLLLDTQKIKSKYRDAGFLDADLKRQRIEQMSSKRIKIIIPVDEGTRYRIGKISLSGITLFPVKDVASVIKLDRGEWASQSRIDWNSRMVQEYFGSRGYIDSLARANLTAKSDDKINIEFDVHEGKMAEIRDVVIRGNRVTRDEVIRRELTTLPGKRYNEKKVRTSEARLRNLGYFERVATYNESTSRSGLYDLVYMVDERRMGRLSVGASFSSIDKLVGFFEIAHGNFDIRRWPPLGDGQKINLRAEMGSERQNFSFSFTEPWFLNRRLALGFDLFSRESRYLSGDYDQKNVGGSVSLTQPIGKFERLRTACSIENYNIYNVDDNASDRIKEEAGKWLKSSLSSTVSRDTRDKYLIPTRGNRTSFTASMSGGMMQGDIDIYSLQLKSAQYWNPWWDHVISLRAKMGVVDYYGQSNRVPIFDRFFLGGPFSMRGFDYRDVGPVDEDQEPLGGNSMAYGSAEYTIPIVKAIRLASFYDAGMVWSEAWNFDGSINSDYGFGVRFDIPMFPIRLDYAWPLQADEHNDRNSGRFSFAIGNFF